MRVCLYTSPTAALETVTLVLAATDIDFRCGTAGHVVCAGRRLAVAAGLALYDRLYARRGGDHTRFMFFYAIAIHAAMAIALSGNLLTLFVFYEV